MKRQVWDMLERAGFIEALGRDHFHATDAVAIAAFSRTAEREAIQRR